MVALLVFPVTYTPYLYIRLKNRGFLPLFNTLILYKIINEVDIEQALVEY